MILGYSFKDYIDCNIKVPVNISLPYKTSNILITGKSGSGKSLSTLYYMWNLLHTKEVYNSDGTIDIYCSTNDYFNRDTKFRSIDNIEQISIPFEE